MGGGVRLARPSLTFRESVVGALREFHDEGRYREYSLADPAADCERLVRRLLDDEHREKLPPHLVPATHYWLVEGADFIGRVSLRHELTEQLRLIGGHIGYEIRPSRRGQGYGKAALGLVLPKARARGLERVLVTCDADNHASRRIIEHHGGVPDRPYAPPGAAVPALRYWIALAEPH